MKDESVNGRAWRRDAKEYAMFCRVRRLFMVDGLEHWKLVLRRKGLSEAEIGMKLAAAAQFIRTMAEPGQKTRVPPAQG